MPKPVFTVALVFSFLVFLFLVSSVSADASSLGVKAGDTFVYSFGGSWQSNQTGVEAPLSIQDQYDLSYIASAIISVDGASVTANSSYFYSTGIYMEIAATAYGGGYVPFYIPAGLGEGSLVPNTELDGSPTEPCYINNTLSQTFASQSRVISCLKIVFPVEGFSNVSCNAYWDQATGVLTEVDYMYSNQTGDTMTEWSMTLKLIETSLFAVSDSSTAAPSDSASPLPSATVPELPPTVVALTMTTLLIAVLVYKKHNSCS
jgi:hypothetical protein